MMDRPRYTLVDGKHLLAEPCLEIVGISYASGTEVGPGLERVLRVFTAQFEARFTYYRTGDMKRFRPYEARALEGPLHWFDDGKMLSTKMLNFEVHCGTSDKDAASPSADFTLLGFQQPPTFVVRLTLPVEAGSAPDRVIAFVQEAFADFELTNGYAGYSFYFDVTDPRRRKEVPPWSASMLRRHPGLNYRSAVALANAANRGVAAVGWLTLLGPAMTADLGGIAGLRSRASGEVSVLPLGAGGAIVRAGAEPQVGDVNRQDVLPAYREAGRLVAPRRAPDEAFEHVAVDGMSAEVAYEWLRRFFV
jgi:hypothetical protein